MLIIVGLGNPGIAYRNTYHNTGFAAVDKLAAAMGGTFKRNVCRAKVCELYVNGEKIVVAKPQTYMNSSGESVRELIGYYHAAPTDVVVVFDDIALPLGTLRMREKGSGGTHNGMRSVVGMVGENVVRLRVGIGEPPENVPLIDFVLQRVKGEAAVKLSEGTDAAARVLRAYIDTRSVSMALRAGQ